jgi:glycogen debranching enzyme
MKHNELRQKVAALLEENMVNGYSKSGQAEFHYAKPSPDTYPFQFFWDTCFHVFILCALDEAEMAEKHLTSLFALQDKDGFVGHSIYWNNVLPGRSTDIFQSRPGLGVNLLRTHMSALIQPPIAAQAAGRIFELTGNERFLAELLPKLKSYYNWIARNRDFDGDGLVTIISPFESGMDWKPSFDPVLGFPRRKANWKLFLRAVSVDARNFIHDYDLEKIKKKNYFRVKETGMNAIYIQNLYVLASLCQAAGDPEETHFRTLADTARESLTSIMYDAEDAAFYDVYGPKNHKLRILTPTVFFPLAIEGMDRSIAKKVIDRHFYNKEEFAAPYPLPSVALNDPAFSREESLYLWRGPSWVFLNWFLHGILIKYGQRDAAENLTKTVLNLIEKSGFREYYEPFTGQGMGAKDFTWAGLVIDMIRTES